MCAADWHKYVLGGFVRGCTPHILQDTLPPRLAVGSPAATTVVDLLVVRTTCFMAVCTPLHATLSDPVSTAACIILQVGAALSMVYTSGAPIMFVGCGQTYVDLKKLNVKSVVKSLLK